LKLSIGFSAASLVRFVQECDILGDALEKLVVKYEELHSSACDEDCEVDLLLAEVFR
jgi:hypothetical protein